jgi:Zn-dependent protease
MLSQLLSGNVSKFYIIQLLLSVPIILLSLSWHEAAHALAASRLGDNTARNLGRLTLNPAKHLDPVGALLMLLFGFGYAKPVPINTRNMKNGKWGFVLSSLAGPASNLILAFAAAFLHRVYAVMVSYINISNERTAIVVVIVDLFFMLAVSMNISLAIFNLLPVPPLDGSRLLTALLPRSMAMFVFRYERYFQMALMLLIFAGAFSNVLTNCVITVENVLYYVVDLIPFELLAKI